MRGTWPIPYLQLPRRKRDIYSFIDCALFTSSLSRLSTKGHTAQSDYHSFGFRISGRFLFFLQYVTRPRAGTLDAQPRCQWESAEVVDLVSLQDIRWLDWLNSCSPLKEFLSHFLEERRKWSLACESNRDEADWSRLKHAPHIDFVLSLAFILHSLLSHFGPTTSSLLFDLPIVPRPLFRPRAHRRRRRRSCDRVYSCHFQVPTDLGLVSHQVQLEVLVPDVFILGPKDLIVDRGTTLSLVCIVENVREYPTTSTTTTGCRPCY